jgi:hypothetical protein
MILIAALRIVNPQVWVSASARRQVHFIVTPEGFRHATNCAAFVALHFDISSLA